MARNPYRLSDREERAFGDALLAPLTGYQDRGMGPGLLGADIHDIARRHYKAGHEEARREMQAKLDESIELRGDAWDEGHEAGYAERSRSLANDFRVRIVEAHFVLQQIERGPKSKAFESLPQLRAQVNDLIAFAQSMAAQTPESDAMHGARARVARDGGTSQTVTAD